MACLIEALLGCFLLFSCGSEICRNTSSREKRRSYADLYEQDCTICLEKIKKDEKKRLKCGHCYHGNCYEEWMDTHTVILCPNCGK